MNTKLLLLTIALGLLMATGVQASDLGVNFDLWDVNTPSTHYLDVNTHGGTPGDNLNFQGTLINNSLTDNLYLNSFLIDDPTIDPSLNPSGDFANNAITFDTNASWWKGSGYAYGSGIPLTPGEVFGGVLFTAHTFDGWTQPGLYSGNFKILGGADANASEVLAEMSFSLDIVRDYGGFTDTLVNPVQTGGLGYVATYTQRYDNPLNNKTVFVDTVWGSSSDYTNAPLNFIWGWPHQVDPGQSMNSDILSLTINSGVPATYYGNAATIGGYYPGDAHQFIPADQLQINVESPRAVPEPATLLGFGLPMLMIGIGKLRGLRK